MKAEAMEVKADATKVKAQAMEVKTFGTQIKALAKEVAGLPFEPVSGNMFYRLGFVLTSLGVIVFGLTTVITNATGAWSQPFAEIQFGYELELPYPDVYLCLPAQYVASYQSNVSNKVFVHSSGTLATARTHCGDATAPVKMDPTTTKLMGEDTLKLLDSCPYESAVGAAEVAFANSMKSGCDSEDDCIVPGHEGSRDYSTKPIYAKAETLRLALPTYTDGDTPPKTWRPACMAFAARKGAVQKRSENNQYTALLSTESKTFDRKNPFFEAYLVEAGKDPVDAAGLVTATKILFSGFSTIGAAQLNVEKVKDLTKDPPDKDFKATWTYTTWTKNLYGDSELDYKSSVIGFGFSSFTVKKITIRTKSWGEIYADLGGIWAASLAILALAWVKSGHIDAKTTKETYIFKYLPASTKKEFLAGMQVVPKGEENA